MLCADGPFDYGELKRGIIVVGIKKVKPGLASRNHVHVSDAAESLHNRGLQTQIPGALVEAHEHEGVFVIRRSRWSFGLAVWGIGKHSRKQISSRLLAIDYWYGC